ncbi:hypothetical protein IQ07DRAFT_281053 [Pyrenochaeta sp. DS3sAY3a]|nr:hypothetical protein IQ07DRAFT_281053 [Pyrenochaeta sp. DS3sAY3a]
MASHSPKIHVLDKSDYSKHQLVSLRNTSLASLAPSSIRFRPRILGLTTNNLTYARMGAMMGWYDIYPLPASTPAPFDDKEKYGRVSAWGYADIIESTVPGISAGQTIYGYLPITTDVEDIRIEFAQHNGQPINDQILALDEHRQHLWKVYNRYQVREPLDTLEQTQGRDSLGWDALMQGLFGTSYNLSTYAFAWNDANRIHPSGQGAWSAADADLRNATVVILNASGKTGMSFAYALRNNRPTEHQPRSVIGVGSPASVSMIKSSGFYDEAVLNADAASTASAIANAPNKTSRIVLLDFGARPGANEAWKDALSALDVPFRLVTVGGEVETQNPEKMMKRFANMANITMCNASLLREKGIEVGGAQYFEQYYKAFDVFKTRVVGIKLRWAEGLEEWEKGWEAFCRDEVRADTGLVYKI